MTKDLEESGPLGPYDEIEAMPPHTSSSSCVDDATHKSTASGLVKEHLPPLHLDAEKSEKKHYRAGTLHASEEVEHKFVMPFIPWNIIILLIFSALAESFGSSAISLFINLTLEYEPVQVTRYWMYVGLTIWMQPIIGYVADVFVIFGEKRRPLYIISAVGNTVIYCVYCFFPGSTATYGKLLGISMVSQFMMMGIYIPLNGLLVEIGRTDGETEDESTARIATIMSKAMVWRSSGSLAGTVLQTCLVLFMSVRELLGVTAICHFILIPLVLIAPRSLFLRPSLHTTNFYVSIQRTFNLLKTSFDITNLRSDGFLFILVLTFVFIYTLMPDASSVYYNYLYGEFMFEAWFYSMNNCLGMFGSIVGAYLFSLWMDYRALQEARGGVRTSIFFIFLIGSIAWALGYVTNLMLCTGFITDTLHISAEVFIPIDNFFMSMFVRFAFMPTIAMAAEHAPKYFEATAFEVFSVVSTGGGTASSMITAFIAEDLHITRSDYSNLWILIVISIGCKLVPIPLAYILPTRKSEEEDAMAMQRRMEEELPYSDPVIGGDAYMDPYVMPTCNPAGTGPQQVVVE